MRQGQYAKPTSCLPRWLYYGAAVALLVGCQPEGPEATFANYLSSLSMALSVERRDIKPTVPLLPPAVSSVQLDVPTGRLETLDFLTVSDCAMQANINKRATSLGRWAKPSQRLFLGARIPATGAGVHRPIAPWQQRIPGRHFANGLAAATGAITVSHIQCHPGE